MSKTHPPPHLSIYVQNSSTPLTLDVQCQTNPPTPLQMTTNQLKENISQGWLLHAINYFFQVGFRFQYQLINIVCLSFNFFSFSWSLTLCFFGGFIPLSVQLSKNVTKCLLFIIIHIFSTHFAINLFYLHNLNMWTSYGTTTTPCMWTNEIKTKARRSHVTFKLITQSIARFSQQVMQWYH